MDLKLGVATAFITNSVYVYMHVLHPNFLFHIQFLTKNIYIYFSLIALQDIRIQ